MSNKNVIKLWEKFNKTLKKPDWDLLINEILWQGNKECSNVFCFNCKYHKKRSRIKDGYVTGFDWTDNGLLLPSLKSVRKVCTHDICFLKYSDVLKIGKNKYINGTPDYYDRRFRIIGNAQLNKNGKCPFYEDKLIFKIISFIKKENKNVWISK